MTGTLYLCATPIGNLGDITLRVLETLKGADLIAAEDTRSSMRLLNHFDIHTPLTSYHEFNKIEKGRELISVLLSGKSVALITDAGTPGISDPGEELVAMAYEAGIPVTSLPGASACVTALTMSGMPTRRFAFEAFLPKDKKKRARVLEEMKSETRTIVLYESPHHLKQTLAELSDALGARRVALCRELTKIHEEVLQMTLPEAVEYYQTRTPRGEYVLVIAGRSFRQIEEDEQRSWEDLEIPAHVKLYEAQGLSRKEAMKQAAVDRGIPKREIYQALLQAEEET